ncbi:MAG: tetraacyldisaccharide 4'-kinase [Bacteroidetes bacterium]|nr:MAG: tetraacyldisaccharide 4'-kinase [Bacteroidota bacterium]
MSALFRLLLFPLALCYGLAVRVRNKCFDMGFLWRSKRYPIPLISVGNLTVGGTGKTPHVEYLIRLLQPHYRVATLSRGYGRRTRGFRLAGAGDDFLTVGDEPMQYYTKFKKVMVSVSNSRQVGVRRLMEHPSSPDVILMDDGFQHRFVKPGLSILLTDFYHLYVDDHLMPSGTLREHVSGADRADLIIVSKSGKVLSPITRRDIAERLRIKPHQQLLFSYIAYQDLKPIPGLGAPPPLESYSSLVVFSGIANTYPFKNYLKKFASDFEILEFPDHHRYSVRDVLKIKQAYENLFPKNKAIVTTGKDAMRLQHPKLLKHLKGLPIYYLPIEVAFHHQDGEIFDRIVQQFVADPTAW